MRISEIHRLAIMIVLFAAIGLSSCGGGGSNSTTAEKKKVIVYSPHGAHLEREVKARFDAAYPLFSLEFQDMSGATIFPKIKAEKDRPGADVWWGGYVGDFKRAETLGLLEPYTADWMKNLPDDAKSPTGGWSSTFKSPQVIMFNENKVKRADAPKSWDELLDPKWKGRVIIRDVRPSTTMRTTFGAIILREKAQKGSVEAGFEFLRKLDAQTGNYAAKPDIMYDLLRSPETPYAVTLWTMADAPMLKAERGMPFDHIPPQPGPFAYDQSTKQERPPTDFELGTVPVIYEPTAILRNCKNLEGAKLFYEFVNKPEQLILMAKERQRIPARTDIPADQLPEFMRTPIKPMKLDWDEFDKNIEEWILRWDTEVKGKNK